jgi:hypothetical protein
MGKMSSIYQVDNDTFPSSDAGVKDILQKARMWDATRPPAAYTYLFCSSADKYAIITLSAPGIPAYSSGAGTTVHYWSSDKGYGTYLSGADNNWTPNCNLAIGAITWRQVSSSVN